MNIPRRGYLKFTDVKEARFVKIKQVNVYVVDTGSYQLVMAESITDEGLEKRQSDTGSGVQRRLL